jgi:Xaa-Pro aminopeptidase
MADAEHAAKRRRLLALLDRAGLEGLLLTRPANVAWYLGGPRVHVELSNDAGVADVFVTREADHLYTDVIEAERLQREEIADIPLTVHARPWQADRVSRLPLSSEVGADAALGPCQPIGGMLDRERARLEPAEIDRYRAAGAAAAEALTQTALTIGPRDRERPAAARLSAALLERGLDPLVLLVSGASRSRIRHPLPTDAPLGDRAMLVVCGRRHGLVCSATRIVAFRPLDSSDRDRVNRLIAVDAAFNTATRPDRAVADIFAAGTRAYGANGFDAGEWEHHHQGGPTGYKSRDEIATPESRSFAQLHQAFAWNPSADGFKVEDTVLVTEGLPEVLTVDAAWPTVNVEGMARPLVLER